MDKPDWHQEARHARILSHRTKLLGEVQQILDKHPGMTAEKALELHLRNKGMSTKGDSIKEGLLRETAVVVSKCAKKLGEQTLSLSDINSNSR